MTSLTEEELLDTISEHTTLQKGALWLRHIRYNEKHYGFKQTIGGGDANACKGFPAVVIGAGPGFKRFGYDDLNKIKLHSNQIIIVACDGALSTLAQVPLIPDYIISVDAHPVVANFFRRNISFLKGDHFLIPTPVLSTTIHRDVVEACLEAGLKIKWVQPFWRTASPRVDANFDVNKFHRGGVTSIMAGGNVGTMAYIMTAQVLQCRPIGLLGLEFAWSDETPLSDSQYFDQILKAVGGDPKKARSMYYYVHNKRDGKHYYADPTYFAYATWFRELFLKQIDKKTRENTYNLTKQGILDVEGLKYIPVEEFVKL